MKHNTDESWMDGDADDAEDAEELLKQIHQGTATTEAYSKYREERMKAAIEPGKTFWMVWKDRGVEPQKKHDTFLSAYEEAQRLAGLNPGQAFYVLKAITVATGSVQVTTGNLIDKE